MFFLGGRHPEGRGGYLGGFWVLIVYVFSLYHRTPSVRMENCDRNSPTSKTSVTFPSFCRPLFYSIVKHSHLLFSIPARFCLLGSIARDLLKIPLNARPSSQYPNPSSRFLTFYEMGLWFTYIFIPAYT